MLPEVPVPSDSIRALFVAVLTLFVAYYLYVTLTTRTCTIPARVAGGMQSMSAPKANGDASKRRVFSLQELNDYRGDSSKQQASSEDSVSSLPPSTILLSVNGEVYNVTSHPSGRDFYAPGKPYHVFAGCDATVPLGRMEINKDLCNRVELWSTLTPEQCKIVADWIHRFRSKYTFVGTLKEAKGKQLDLSDFSCPPFCPPSE